MSQLNSKPGDRPKIAEHYCLTRLKEVSTSMQWVIDDFDLLRMDSSHCLESCSFESVSEGIHTGTWKMKLVPKFAKKGTLGLFFNFSGTMANTFAEFEACLIGEDGKETNKMKLACELLHNDIGFEEFLNRDSLVDSLLPDGLLNIKGNITVIRMNSTQSKSGHLDDGDTLSEDFSKLMKEEIFSDAALICDDRKFPVHKCILSARSSLFRTKFTGEWKEKDSVEIKDMEADILENLLSYIYTDNILDLTTVDMAMKLLEVAGRYGLQELKEICGDYLAVNISIHNLFEVAKTADLQSLESLKEACITFMCEHGKEIVLSDSFKDIHKTAPQYLLERVLKRHFGIETKPEVTSCPSCDPSLHHCTSAVAFPVLPDQPNGFGMPLPTLKFPNFNFGPVSK